MNKVEIVYNELARSYKFSENFQGASDDNLGVVLARSVVAKIENPRDVDQIAAEIRNTIWMTYSGGGVATNTTVRICEKLGIATDSL